MLCIRHRSLAFQSLCWHFPLLLCPLGGLEGLSLSQGWRRPELPWLPPLPRGLRALALQLLAPAGLAVPELGINALAKPYQNQDSTPWETVTLLLMTQTLLWRIFVPFWQNCVKKLWSLKAPSPPPPAWTGLLRGTSGCELRVLEIR